MAYTDKINWPSQLDSFPSLYNYGQTFNVESTIVYAEHYNKLKNYILKIQGVLKKGALNVGAGITSFSTLYTFTIPIASIINSTAFTTLTSDIYSTSTNPVGGRTLPFQFVISKTGGDFTRYVTACSQLSSTPMIFISGLDIIFDDIDIFDSAGQIHTSLNLRHANDLVDKTSVNLSQFSTNCKVTLSDVSGVTGSDVIIISGVIENRKQVGVNKLGHALSAPEQDWYSNLVVNLNLIFSS